MSISALISRLMGGSSGAAIEHDDMVKAVETGQFYIADVREPEEYASGHVAGAQNHPLSRFNPQDLPKTKPVILICQAGGRSARALQQAVAAGYDNVVHYAAGTGGWKARGGKVE